jgi:hypothetical protein
MDVFHRYSLLQRDPQECLDILQPTITTGSVLQMHPMTLFNQNNFVAVMQEPLPRHGRFPSVLPPETRSTGVSVQPPTNNRFHFVDATASVSKVFVSFDKSTQDTRCRSTKSTCGHLHCTLHTRYVKFSYHCRDWFGWRFSSEDVIVWVRHVGLSSVLHLPWPVRLTALERGFSLNKIL